MSGTSSFAKSGSHTIHPHRSDEILSQLEIKDDCIIDSVPLHKSFEIRTGMEKVTILQTFSDKMFYLNGKIISSMEAFPQVYSTRKIINNIRELDSLISDFNRHHGRNTALTALHFLGKSYLLHRIADLLIIQQEHDESNMFYAFACHKLALSELLMMDTVSEVSEVLNSLKMLEYMILKTFENYSFNESEVRKLLLDKQFGQKLCKKIGFDCNSNFRKNSYVCSLSNTDLAANLSNEESVIPSLMHIVHLVDRSYFLHYISWLLCFNGDLSNSDLSFVDAFCNVLPEEEQNELNEFTESSLNRMDVKILLLASAERARLSWKSYASAQGINLKICPVAVLMKPTSRMLAVWKALISKLQTTRSSPSAALKILSIMEMSRLRSDVPDVQIVHAVFIWLTKFHPNSSRCRLFVETLMAVIDGTRYEERNFLTSYRLEALFDSFVDQASTALDDLMYEHAQNWLNGSQLAILRCDSGELVHVDIPIAFYDTPRKSRTATESQVLERTDVICSVQSKNEDYSAFVETVSSEGLDSSTQFLSGFIEPFGTFELPDILNDESAQFSVLNELESDLLSEISPYEFSESPEDYEFSDIDSELDLITKKLENSRLQEQTVPRQSYDCNLFEAFMLRIVEQLENDLNQFVDHTRASMRDPWNRMSVTTPLTSVLRNTSLLSSADLYQSLPAVYARSPQTLTTIACMYPIFSTTCLIESNTPLTIPQCGSSPPVHNPQKCFGCMNETEQDKIFGLLRLYGEKTANEIEINSSIINYSSMHEFLNSPLPRSL